MNPTRPTLRPATPADFAAIEAHMRRAFAPNAIIMGVEPLPLRANYADILATHEAYVAERDGALEGALILLPRADDLYVWGIATAPHLQQTGIGGSMLAFAEARARELGHALVRLRTGEKMVTNVAWYQRHGFTIENIESMEDRGVVNFVKALT